MNKHFSMDKIKMASMKTGNMFRIANCDGNAHKNHKQILPHFGLSWISQAHQSLQFQSILS